MRLVTMLAMTLAVVACGGKKDKDGGGGTGGTGGTTGSSTGSSMAGTGSASGSAAGSDAGSAAGSATGSAGSGSGDNVIPAGSDTPTGDKDHTGAEHKPSGVTFGEKLPDGWVDSGLQLDHVEAVNESEFPADNAQFVFDYGLDDPTMPKDPKEYQAVLEKALGGEKIVKDDKLPNGHYFETAHAFRYVIDAGDKRIHCGGSLYKDADYDKIAKVRDAAVANAKKLCASAKL